MISKYPARTLKEKHIDKFKLDVGSGVYNHRQKKTQQKARARRKKLKRMQLSRGLRASSALKN
jgi:hypothetical protein